MNMRSVVYQLRLFLWVGIGLMMGLLLVACNDDAPTTTSSEPTATAVAEIPPSPTTAPTDTAAPTATHTAEPPTATPTAELPTATPTVEPPTPTPAPTNTPQPNLPALPPDAQRIEFEADDGTELVGYYFPAAVNPAPVIVLMHWAGGDQTDWQYTGVVSWLQNRDQPIPAPPQPKFFDTPYTLLTPLPETESYGVFTFDFRGFGESGAGDFASTVADARSAYALVATLPGVDPDRIIGIGASIGAIQVINGCQEDCQGALSIGPQNLLEGFSYATAVTTLDEADKPAWCIVAADMDVDYEACSEASGRLHQQQIYDEGGHAMMLFRAELDLQPPLDEVILDFIHTVLERP